MTPRVSIITATRNRPELIVRALKSIKRQTLHDFESIVVDDGSRTEVLQEYRRFCESDLDDRFILTNVMTPNAPGSGPACTRNRGVQQARGDYVAFLDDDDVWVKEDYLEVAVNLMDERGSVYFFGHLQGIRDDRLMNPGWVPDPVALYQPTKIHDSPPVFRLRRRDLVHLAQRFMIQQCSIIVRRKVLENIGGFFEYLRHSAEDSNLMLRISDHVDEALYRSDCVTHNRLPTGDSISLKIEPTTAQKNLNLGRDDFGHPVTSVRNDS